MVISCSLPEKNTDSIFKFHIQPKIGDSKRYIFHNEEGVHIASCGNKKEKLVIEGQFVTFYVGKPYEVRISKYPKPALPHISNAESLTEWVDKGEALFTFDMVIVHINSNTGRVVVTIDYGLDIHITPGEDTVAKLGFDAQGYLTVEEDELKIGYM